MCVAIPYKVLEVKENSQAEIEVAGARHKVSLWLFPEVEVGDWMLVNLGYVVARIEVDTSEMKVVCTIPMPPDKPPTETVGVLPFIHNGPLGGFKRAIN